MGDLSFKGETGCESPKTPKPYKLPSARYKISVTSEPPNLDRTTANEDC